MRSALAASAVLALAGSSYGFVVAQFAIQPNESITPNVGSFHQELNAYGNSFVVVNMPTGYGPAWGGNGPKIRGSTWLAGDRDGGAGVFTLGPPNRPEWNAATGSQLTSAGSTIIQNAGATFPTINGGSAGLSWTANATASFQMPSAVSLVNGVSVDSIFLGNFVFDDPGATGLVGADLLMTRFDTGENVFLPLDGSKGDTGFNIVYEEFESEQGKSGLRAFAVIPTPGATALLGVAGLAGIRRRRKW